MDLFVESANKIYEKIISLRNKKADKKTRDELQTQLEIDLMKNGGKRIKRAYNYYNFSFV